MTTPPYGSHLRIYKRIFQTSLNVFGTRNDKKGGRDGFRARWKNCQGERPIAKA